MRPFPFLTEQGRARRLRALAFAALEHYDLDIRRIKLVNNETNCTFRLDAADGRSYALRISIPDLRSTRETEAEIAWLTALASDTDIAVSRPFPARSGAFVVTAEARGVPEPRHCVVFEWLRGKTLAERPTIDNLEAFGRLAARLHRCGKTYQPPDPEAIRRMSSPYPMGGPEKIPDDDTRTLFPPESFRQLLEMCAAVERELDWLFSSDETLHVIHGDFHWWNVMVGRSVLHPIDFEDLCRGYPVQDIAITLYYMDRNDKFPERRAAFRRGYESVAPWPEMYPGQIELHMVHRALDLFNFVLGSSYRHDRELLDSFIEAIQGHHRRTFEIWQSSFEDDFYR